MPLKIGKVKSAPVVMDATEVFAGWVLGPAARVATMSMREGLQGVLFDLDGVLVDTARYHYLAWKRLAEELGVRFDEQMNHGFRGVGRMECLDKLLGEHGRFFAAEEKVLLAERKNGYYLEMVARLNKGDVATGAWTLMADLRRAGVRMAVVSASKNARMVLERLGIMEWFDAVVDGTELVKGKGDGFLRAAERMRVKAERCVVVEDAEAGVKAAQRVGMKCVGVGETAVGAEVCVGAVGELRKEMMERMVGGGNSNDE